MKDLLAPPSGRPQRFYRGYDVYDPENVGFISDVPQYDQTAGTFFELDTTLPGNSNQGHLYGTELSPKEKAALIEYLKTTGFQTASVVSAAIAREDCDAVSIARSLVANNDLLDQWNQGKDSPAKPCTYCNKCALNALQNPIGCYEEPRFDSHEEMITQIMSVFEPPPFKESS